MAHAKDFIGRRYGNVVIIEFSGWKNATQRWKCQCDCGATFIAILENMERGKIKSCGCVKDPTSKTFISNAEKKILSLIDKQEDCWIWKGLCRKEDKRAKGFYPYCNFNHQQFHPVRFFKKMLGEECPSNWAFKKKCYTKNCVNPDHYDLKSISKIRQENARSSYDTDNE